MILTFVLLLALGGCARAATIEVADQRQFEIAIAGLLPGDRVIVENGRYSFPEIRGRGTASAPIIIEARKGALDGGAAIIEGAAVIKDARHVTLSGFLFEAKEKTFEAIRIVKSEDVAITRNHIHHTDTDYGIRVHASADVSIEDNLVEGQFNHAISSKERVERMIVRGNRFIDCGRGCIEAGQSPDGTIDREQTSGLIEIRGNVFEGRDTKGGKAFVGIGIKIKNAERTIVRNNHFTGHWSYPVQTSFGSTGPKAKNALGHFGPRQPGPVEIIGNDFGKGGELDLSGRGLPDDLFTLKDNRGSVTCVISGFRTHGTPIRKLLDHSTLSEAPPRVRQSNDSFSCTPGGS
ncbi:MAG: right-handed parallel beta-helix repeat-containing protein [Geminicoccaceae bacterium]